MLQTTKTMNKNLCFYFDTDISNNEFVGQMVVEECEYMQNSLVFFNGENTLPNGLQDKANEFQLHIHDVRELLAPAISTREHLPVALTVLEHAAALDMRACMCFGVDFTDNYLKRHNYKADDIITFLRSLHERYPSFMIITQSPTFNLKFIKRAFTNN